jgi:hypothetical protein
VSIDFAALIGPVARKLWGEPNDALCKDGELRWGTRGSKSVNLAQGVWFDHEANEGGGTRDLIWRETGLVSDDAIAWLEDEGLLDGATNTGGRRIVAEYDYPDENGTLLYQVVRYDPKKFLQRRPDGRDGWIWNLDNTRRVLYRLPELIEGIAAEHPVFIPEGEKDVENLRRLGLVATTNPGGASKGEKSKWRPEYNDHLRGADVVLIPDNDETGWKHVHAIGASLTGIAARIRVLMLPGAKDASAWLEAGGTREQLDALIESAPDWVKPAEAEVLEALRAMPKGVERGRRRRELARELGVSRHDIDDEIEARTAADARGPAPLYGHWITDPWPETVEGDSLLRDIILRLQRHVVIGHDEALTVALWVIFSWVHDAVATHSPILLVTSAEPESGKTTVLGILGYLMPRAIVSVDIAEAALYRSIELWQPSFAIDEFDEVLTSEDKRPLRSVINSGHTRGSGVLRCNTAPHDKTPRRFPTFAPKAIGMVGRKMPATTLGRCLIVEMRRKKASEHVERFKHEDDAGLASLRSRLLRWSTDSEESVRDVEPRMPAELDNRRADNWRLLLAIADLAGDEYGDKARAAALKLEGRADKRTLGAQLLAAIRKVFDENGADCILSAALVAALVNDLDQPWAGSAGVGR